MLDAACGDTRRGGGPSIPPSATVLAVVVTVAATLSEANTCPPSSVNVDVTANAITLAADVANNARYDHAVNVDSGLSPAALDNDTNNGGTGSTSVQVAVVSVILNAAKSSLRVYFKGVRRPLNKALPKGAEFLNLECSAWGYHEAVSTREDAGCTSAAELQEGEDHEYTGFYPAQPIRSGREDTRGHGNVSTQVCVLNTAKDLQS